MFNGGSGNGFKIGFIVIILLAVLWFTAKNVGKLETENKVYKQMFEHQISGTGNT